MSDRTNCQAFDPAATYEPPATVTRAQLEAACEALGLDPNEVSCVVWDPDFLQVETKAGPRFVRVVP
jgi:hypothetical protein